MSRVFWLENLNEGKRPLRKSRHKLEDNSRLELRDLVWEGMDWILTQDRDQWRSLMNLVMNLWVP
jgi:hypothetical protein